MSRTGVPPLPVEFGPLVAYLDERERAFKTLQETVETQAATIASLQGEIDVITGTEEEPADPEIFTLVLHIQERSANGNDGKALSSGAWTARDTTEVVRNDYSDIGVSVSVAGAITLTAGTWMISAFIPCFVNNTFRNRLYNTTTAAAAIPVGGAIQPGSTGSNSNAAWLRGVFTLTETSILEIQTYPSSSANAYQAAAMGEQEVGADIMFWKIG